MGIINSVERRRVARLNTETLNTERFEIETINTERINTENSVRKGTKLAIKQHHRCNSEGYDNTAKYEKRKLVTISAQKVATSGSKPKCGETNQNMKLIGINAKFTLKNYYNNNLVPLNKVLKPKVPRIPDPKKLTIQTARTLKPIKSNSISNRSKVSASTINSSTKNISKPDDEITTHMGPFDMSCATFSKPSKLREEILFSLTKMKIAFKPYIVIVPIILRVTNTSSNVKNSS